MMKSLRITFLFLISILITSTVFSQSKQDRNVKRFESVKVESGIDLYLTQGQNQTVEIKADNEIIDQIITSVEGSTLKIYVERKSRWNWNNRNMAAYVSTDHLNSLSASGGSDVESSGTFKEDDMHINASGGSDINMSVTCDKLTINLSGGSDVVLEGNSEQLRIEASGGSDFNGRNFDAKIVNAQVSGGSDAYFNVSEELIARASGGSDIHYKGNPNMRDIDTSSSSDVKKYE